MKTIEVSVQKEVVKTANEADVLFQSLLTANENKLPTNVEYAIQICVRQIAHLRRITSGYPVQLGDLMDSTNNQPYGPGL